MFNHVSLGVTDLPRSKAFYDDVMAALGHGQHFGSLEEEFIAYGGDACMFIINLPLDASKRPAACNGSHFCFQASAKAAVDRFYAAALTRGGTDAGAPGWRPHYADNYYAAFVYDPDGHKLEAVAYVTPPAKD